ncbi:MAG: hypothetical protein JW925_07465 [Syntrophaceae bacterium]|nr:hypothetical protein [Syntrophaceae bacterium]
MFSKKSFIAVMLVWSMITFFALPACMVWAEEEEPPAGDESATFGSVDPDTLIVLDGSGSMNFGPGSDPAYSNRIYGSSTACTPDATNCAGSGSPSYCENGFCYNSKTNCNVNCSRMAIAKRALFSIMDDDNNNTIDINDSNSLGVRIGFMRFRDTAGGYCSYGNDTAGDYTKHSIKLITMLSALGKETGTSYSLTYCGNSTSCASTATSCSSGECILNQTPCGGTPLASALNEAKLYLDAHKDKDKAKECRMKFAILITDGADTYACSGNGTECQEHMYKRRRQVVAQAAALKNAGYKVFVIGFAQGMPAHLKNTLEWAAFHGGTDNPSAVNSGDTTAYTIPTGETYPTGTSSCAASTVDTTVTCSGTGYDAWGNPYTYTINTFKAASLDPGYLDLTGYAFIASNATELTNALRDAIGSIREQTYSFTRVSVQTVRSKDENYIYAASFLPLTDVANDSFWIGHLERFTLKTDGSLTLPADWDAGTILKNRTGSDRTIYTLGSAGSLMAFNTVTAADLGVATTATRDGIVNFIYNGELSGANIGYKLGDIFHSSPISIGTPSAFFKDMVETDGTDAYDAYRAAHPRTSVNGKRLIVAGANDGQFHVFKTGEAAAGGGAELWSFVPPNLLTRLQGIYHATHPTSLNHQYFVDGPTTASDIWKYDSSLSSGSSTPDGKSKDPSEWHAYMIVSEGRGGSSTLWCSDQYCHSGCTSIAGVSGTTVANPYYCGYYAFDVTDTLATPPSYQWHFGGSTPLTATQAAHLGQPWSKITIGRVYINGNERWVGFAAGGYSGTDCKTGGTCDTRGKGFYVIDMLNGQILQSFTRNGPDGVVLADMDYSLVGQPGSIDYDDDGFIDTVYASDLGGNVWRFKFCTKAQYTADSTCGISSWTGGLFFETASGNIRPIYTKPTVVHALSGDLWVYFGSGDVTDPTAANAQEKMYGVKDNDRTTKWTLNELSNISSDISTYDPTSTDNGWYINLSGSGQKILSDPTVYADVLYFTVYTPGSETDPCDTSGDSDLWAVDYVTGKGAFYTPAQPEIPYDPGSPAIDPDPTVIGDEIPAVPETPYQAAVPESWSRSVYAGEGIASGAVISENPYGGTNVYVTTSEGSKINPVQPPDPDANKSNLQYWHDMRVQ